MRSSIAGSMAFCLAVLAMTGGGICAERTAKNYAPFPDPDDGYVTDLAGLLSEDQERQLEQWLRRTEEQSGVEIIVVTIDSIADHPGTPKRDILHFARALFDAYGVGNMPRNDGVLLLVAGRDRKARIELGAGYGRAKDLVATRIIARKILPSFHKDDYAEGIMRGTKALMSEFGGVRVLPGWLPWLLGGAGVAMIPVAVSLFKHGKRGWGWVAIGLILVLLLALIWLVRQAAKTVGESHSRPGGLGGFGGGFSGGGGATGSW